MHFLDENGQFLHEFGPKTKFENASIFSLFPHDHDGVNFSGGGEK